MSAGELWGKVLPLLGSEQRMGAMAGILANTQPGLYESGIFTLLVGNPTIATTVERYQQHIEEALGHETGERVSLVVRVSDEVRPPQIAEVVVAQPSFSAKPSASMQPIGLHPIFRFDNFLVFDCNRMAFTAAKQVAAKPGEVYNPLFIHSKAGLGKTHLLQAIGDIVGGSTMYVTAEDFVNEFKEALKKEEYGRDHTREFRERYRRLRCLIVDDLAFLTELKGGGTAFEEEFFHTMNAILMSGGQVVVAAEQPPKGLGIANDALRGRLEMGIVVVIGIPDVETRKAVLKARAEAASTEGIVIADDILEYAARKVAANFRTLIGASNKLHAHLSLYGGDLTISLVDDLLIDYSSSVDCKVFSAREIIEFCAEKFNVLVSDLVGIKRSQDIAWPRQVTIYALRELTDLSLTDIGGHFKSAKKGKEVKDHSTVLYAYNELVRKMAESQETLWFVNQLLEEIRAA